MTVDLPSLFKDLQRDMLGKLGIQNQIRHGPTKGSGTEAAWRSMLESYLPERYSVVNGVVVDSQGNSSDAIDIIVFDRHYSPFMLHDNDVSLVPAESVYAVFEVKQLIDRETMAYAAAKANSVRRLLRTTTSIVHAGGVHNPVGPKPILAGLLATRIAWQPPFGTPFNDALADVGAGIDLGCGAADGGFEVVAGVPTVWNGETGLMRWFLALVRRLQGLGTVAAIDIAAYEASLD